MPVEMKNLVKNKRSNDGTFYDTDHYIKDWIIPFYLGEINQWENKKNALLSLFEKKSKPNLAADGEQKTDFNINNDYHKLVEALLFEDIRLAYKSLGFTGNPEIGNAWFQSYSRAEYHGTHNHGMCALSMVVFIKYDDTKHSPTTFIAPYLSFRDGNVMEFIPDGVHEGSIIMFPSGLMHHAPSNQNDEERLILSANILCS